eukprot:GHVU01066088.1.p1 GENE.GHVU01066088.1~~GHVU01066088.1.p1  ORF type:complete len:101 (-),score=14.73 GHVU01066088.1:29-331(-)
MSAQSADDLDFSRINAIQLKELIRSHGKEDRVVQELHTLCVEQLKEWETQKLPKYRSQGKKAKEKKALEVQLALPACSFIYTRFMALLPHTVMLSTLAWH